jgi:uncharacterized protein YbjT (DUF2867 family)
MDPVIAASHYRWAQTPAQSLASVAPKREGYDMKIVVIGGTGRIGSQVVQKLTLACHKAVPATRSSGVDLVTADGLEQVLKGAEVVINLSNSPTATIPARPPRGTRRTPHRLGDLRG